MKLSTFIVPLLFAIAFVAVVLWFKKKKSSVTTPDGEPPFTARRPFLETQEAELLRRLQAALPGHHVFVQVQVWRVLTLKNGLDASMRTRWRNSIDRLLYDFVICDPTLAVRAVIELDGASHEAADQRARDRKKDEATKVAGIELLRYRNGALPDVAAIAARFAPSSLAASR